MAGGVRLCVCDALILDRQIVHIYHVKFNIVNKNMRIHTYIQLSCIILIEIVVHYDYSMFILIFVAILI